MNRHRAFIHGCLLGLALALACTPVAAQQVKVDDLVVNLGIVPAEVALRADGHRDAHPLHPPSGSQHVLITVEDAKRGAHIGDADVVVEVTDPHRHVERKTLLHTQAGGVPDYSELFVFGWSGDYVLRVLITTKGGAKPVEARYTIHHAV